jgi:hypothetical protein
MLDGVLVHHDTFTANVTLADGQKQDIVVRHPHFLHSDRVHGTLAALHLLKLEVELFTTNGGDGELDLVYFPGVGKNTWRIAVGIGELGWSLFSAFAAVKTARKTWAGNQALYNLDTHQIDRSTSYHPATHAGVGIQIATNTYGVLRPLPDLAREFVNAWERLQEPGFYAMDGHQPVGVPLIRHPIYRQDLVPA